MLGIGPWELIILITVLTPAFPFFIGRFLDATLWKNRDLNKKMSLPQTLFSLKGRINRAKWWLMRLLIIAAFIVVGMFFGALAQFVKDEILIIFIVIVVIGFFNPWVNFAVDVKRWHDRDKSGWWILIGLIPIIGSIWAFVELGFLNGTGGPNRFGADPLEHS